MALPVLILVRPFARVEIENGPSSLEPSTRHSLRLPPGEHRVTVTCDVCEPVSRSVKVAPGRTNRFNLAAQIQRSELSFEVSPPGAWIRIGDERRTAEESLSRPFTVESPPGALSHAHRVEYEIALEGYAPIRRSLRLPAGERLTIAGRLSPL